MDLKDTMFSTIWRQGSTIPQVEIAADNCATLTREVACKFALFMKEQKAVELITEGKNKGKWIGVIGDTLGRWTTEQLFEIFLRD